MANSQFYVTLPSTSSFKYFPENKISSYTTRLHAPLRLKGEWEVALVEINYPRTWYNISGDTCKIYYQGKHDQELESTQIPSGYYESAEEILHELRRALPEYVKRNLEMYIKSKSRKCVINCSHGTGILFNETLSRMLGFVESTLKTQTSLFD